ncbi:MAG TPA: hypothetical protein VGJ97_11410, partial [Anaerolineaceae bacterium]
MGITRIAFPIDLDGFRKDILSVLPQMEEGNFENLRNLAWKIGQQNNTIWHFLDYFGYFRDDLGREDIEFDSEATRIAFWINVVLVSHCIAYSDKTP